MNTNNTKKDLGRISAKEAVCMMESVKPDMEICNDFLAKVYKNIRAASNKGLPQTAVDLITNLDVVERAYVRKVLTDDGYELENIELGVFMPTRGKIGDTIIRWG